MNKTVILANISGIAVHFTPIQMVNFARYSKSDSVLFLLIAAMWHPGVMTWLRCHNILNTGCFRSRVWSYIFLFFSFLLQQPLHIICYFPFPLSFFFFLFVFFCLTL